MSSSSWLKSADMSVKGKCSGFTLMGESLNVSSWVSPPLATGTYATDDVACPSPFWMGITPENVAEAETEGLRAGVAP